MPSPSLGSGVPSEDLKEGEKGDPVGSDGCTVVRVCPRAGKATEGNTSNGGVRNGNEKYGPEKAKPRKRQELIVVLHAVRKIGDRSTRWGTVFICSRCSAVWDPWLVLWRLLRD
jgi:hypothetical protein